MNWKTLILALIVSFCSLTALGQDESSELNCTVEINADKVSNANKEIFNTLKEAIAEYMNTTKWTDAVFGANEKIQCKLFFIINTYTTGYSCTVMENVLRRHLEERHLDGKVEADEIGIKIKDSDYILPCGQTTRFYR